MAMTQETKAKLFQKMLELETLGEQRTFDNVDYIERANGAFEMLKVLGIDTEYIIWSCGK